MTVKISEPFEKQIKRLSKSYRSVVVTVRQLILTLANGELPGDRVSGTALPSYKVRLPNRDANRGKSGGFRVVYVTVVEDTVYLIAIYSKTDTAGLSAAEINELIEELPEEHPPFDVGE